MPLKTDTIDEPSLNLTPMIDIVFLLIIFFMVGSEFTRKKAEAEVRYEIQLPTVAEVQPLTDAPDPIAINIEESGRIHVSGGPAAARNLECDVPGLEVFLKDAKAADARQNFDDRAVVIRSDADARHKSFIAVVEVLKRLKYRTLSVAAKPVGEAPRAKN